MQLLTGGRGQGGGHVVGLRTPNISLPGFVCVAAENRVSSYGSIDYMYVGYDLLIFGKAGISAMCTATVQAQGLNYETQKFLMLCHRVISKKNNSASPLTPPQRFSDTFGI
jgi:hypothetical protein